MSDSLGKGFKLINCTVKFNNETVGGVQELNFNRSDENTVEHEAGNLNPIDIVSGKRIYEGTVNYLWLDTKYIKAHQEFSDRVGDDIYFDIEGFVNDNSGRKVKIENAKFKGFSVDMSHDTTTAVSKDFDALFIDFV